MKTGCSDDLRHLARPSGLGYHLKRRWLELLILVSLVLTIILFRMPVRSQYGGFSFLSIGWGEDGGGAYLNPQWDWPTGDVHYELEIDVWQWRILLMLFTLLLGELYAFLRLARGTETPRKAAVAVGPEAAGD